MMIKLQPVFFDKVWGGNKIKTQFHYDCSNSTGEAWGISAHKHGSSTVVDGPYQGLTLRELYRDHRELFGNYPKDEFPILVKIIDANDDLSIQVHPDDEYARLHENSLGKTECWYILDTEPNTEIVIGHKAKNLDEFKEYFYENRLESIINRFPIHSGETFCVYSGTIHAICKGTLLLEIQQSSDVTYRLYDYNRPYQGKLRELHIDQAFDVIKFPDNELNPDIPKHLFDFNLLQNHDSESFIADRYGDYLFITEGGGLIDGVMVKKGDFIFVPAGESYQVEGPFTYIKTNIK